MGLWRTMRSMLAAATLGALTVQSNAVTVQAATCTASAFSVVTSEYGLDVCVGNNLATLLTAIAGSSSTCSLATLLAIPESEAFANVTTLIEAIVASPDDVSSLIFPHMQATGATQMASFCSDFSSKLVPCLDALLPTLLPVIKADTTCCSQASDLIDMLNFFVPSNSSMTAFILNQVNDGINKFFCAKQGTTLCGTNLYSQMTSKYSKSTFSVLGSFMLPFLTIAPGEECSAMNGNAYLNTASLQSSSTIDYGCCINEQRPLMQTAVSALEYLLGNDIVDIFNGVVDFDNSTNATFVDALTPTSSCTFSTTCTNPSALTTTVTAAITPGTNNPGKNTIYNVTCTSAKKCDAAGTTCSTICEKDTASVSTWLNGTLAYQRKLAYNQPLCYAQLPSTHNSAITLADGYGNRDQLFNLNLNSAKSYSYMKTNNQVLSIIDQLNIGIRSVEIDTHYFLDDFHTGHCGNLGSTAITALFTSLEAELSAFGTVLWGPELLGCFPSLSGIPADEQVTTRSSLQEVRTWLDKEENQDDFVMVYLDTGSEISDLDKYTALNTLLMDIFGDLIVPQASLKTLASGSWKSGSVQTFIDAGYRVLVLANANTGLAYSLYDYCGGHKVLSTSYINTLPDSSRKLGGYTIYGNSYLLRSYQAELRYISLSDEGVLTNNFSTLLNSSNIANYVRWNLNMVDPDMVDGAKMQAMAWSWAENEPSTTTSSALVYINTSGRWVASTSLATTYKACYSSSALVWSIISYSSLCASGYTFTAPQDPYQNYLLKTQMLSSSITIPVVINATLDLDASSTSASGSSDVEVAVNDSSTSASSSGSVGDSGSLVASSSQDAGVVVGSTSAGSSSESASSASGSSSSSSGTPEIEVGSTSTSSDSIDSSSSIDVGSESATSSSRNDADGTVGSGSSITESSSGSVEIPSESSGIADNSGSSSSDVVVESGGESRGSFANSSQSSGPIAGSVVNSSDASAGDESVSASGSSESNSSADSYAASASAASTATSVGDRESDTASGSTDSVTVSSSQSAGSSSSISSSSGSSDSSVAIIDSSDGSTDPNSGVFTNSSQSASGTADEITVGSNSADATIHASC